MGEATWLGMVKNNPPLHAIPECTFSRLFKRRYVPKHKNAGKPRVLAINALLHSLWCSCCNVQSCGFLQLPRQGGRYSLIYAIKVCAAPSGRVFGPFSSENRYTLCPFWSRIVYVFRRNYQLYQRIYCFNSKSVRKKQKYANWSWT